MLEPVTWPHPPMNNHFAPFKPFQSPCHNHLAKEKRSITPSRPHYTVSGLMTASSVLAGFMFRPSPMFLLLHRLTGWFLCLFISMSVSQCQSHCSRSWWYTWSVRVCSVDGETVPGMSVGSQWVVLPRYSCLFYKAVRSNEGLHTNTHSDTQTTSNSAGNTPDPCPFSMHIVWSRKVCSEGDEEGSGHWNTSITRGQTRDGSKSGERVDWGIRYLHLCTAYLFSSW